MQLTELSIIVGIMFGGLEFVAIYKALNRRHSRHRIMEVGTEVLKLT